MPRVTSTIEIAAHPEAIWKLMCNPNTYPELADPTDRMTSVPDGEFGLGYTYKEYGGIPPFKSESEWMVTDYEPMTRQIHVGNDGQMRFTLEIRLDPIKGGTRLTQTLDLKPRWYLAPVSALLWPIMMHKRAQAAMDRTVANAKRMVE
jgi:carbon monoxide dehydrogenase subunit G